jgi:hypothetical protein
MRPLAAALRFAFAFGVLALAFPAVAQTAQPARVPAGYDPCQGRFIRPDVATTPTASYHRFFEPGEATVQVSVVGAVVQTGLYEVAVGTDIGRLLALAGGPRYEAREGGGRRRVELRLFRPEAGPTPIYATTLEDAATNTAVYPALCEGDTFLVDVVERRAFGWQEAATIAGGVSAVAILLGTLLGGG